MKIDLLTANLKKKGFTQDKAETYAIEIQNIAKSFGLNPYDLVNEVS